MRREPSRNRKTNPATFCWYPDCKLPVLVLHCIHTRLDYRYNSIDMPEDTKMDESDASAKVQTEETKDEKSSAPVMPPLEAAARRLERSLGGGLREKESVLHTYANPTKVVRRWLGTSSGAAADASFADISSAAMALLNPTGSSSAGRELLVAGNVSSMEVDAKEDESSTNYLTDASEREVECWLLSLSIRLLFKDKLLVQALELVERSINIVLGHLEVASTKLISLSRASSSSLFPLLARMYRYRSLVAEQINDIATIITLRKDMSIAHNLACLRRDVDSQATLLNLMLRDLLSHSQSKSFWTHDLQ